MRNRIVLGAFVLASVLWHPAGAQAQGAIVNGTAAAAIGDGDTGLALAGGIAYRFNHVLGFGVELTSIQGLGDFAYVYRPIDDDPEGSAVVFTTNVRVEIPTTLSRVIPYVTGGGGMASLTRSFSVVYLASGLSDLPALGLDTTTTARYPIAEPLSILPGPSTIRSTTVNMALTLGGGASFLITDHVSIDADLRVLRLLGEGGRNIGRFGAGASYRF